MRRKALFEKVCPEWQVFSQMKMTMFTKNHDCKHAYQVPDHLSVKYLSLILSKKDRLIPFSKEKPGKKLSISRFLWLPKSLKIQSFCQKRKLNWTKIQSFTVRRMKVGLTSRDMLWTEDRMEGVSYKKWFYLRSKSWNGKDNDFFWGKERWGGRVIEHSERRGREEKGKG